MGRTNTGRLVLNFALCIAIALQPSIAFSKKEIPTHKPQFQGQGFEGLLYFGQPEWNQPNAERIHQEERDSQSKLAKAKKAAKTLLNLITKKNEPEPNLYEDWNEYLKDQIEAAEVSNTERLRNAGVDVVDLMLDYKDFYLDNVDKNQALIDRIGKAAFLEKLDKNEISYTDFILGEMEFTTIDNEPVAKIVHEASGVAFIIYDEEKVDRNSEHFEQFLARQHYDAGSSRSDNSYIDTDGKVVKIRKGRDALLMGIKREEISDENPEEKASTENVELAPRKHNPRQWWKATYKHPDLYDVRVGFASGSAQFFSAWALAGYLATQLPGYEPGATPLMIAGFSLLYGSALGVWSRFFHNWRSRYSSEVERKSKNFSTSVGFYIGVYLIAAASGQSPESTEQIATTVTLTDLSVTEASVVQSIQNFFAANAAILSSIAATAHFGVNLFLNLDSKGAGYSVSDVLAADRSDQDMKLGIRMREWNRQFLYYLPSFNVKAADQIWFAWTITPTLMGQMPWYYPLISVGIHGLWTFGSVRALNWWAYSRHPEIADGLDIRKNSRLYFWPEALASKTSSFCSNLFIR